MMVIDDLPEKKLVQALTSLRFEPDFTACIHCKFSQVPEHLALARKHKKQIIALVQKHVTQSMPYGYFCEDGDLFILASVLQLRDAHLLMLAIAEIFDAAVDDHFMELADTNRHINRLLLTVQHKIDSKRAAQEKAQRDFAALQLERKRAAILDSASHAGLRDIAVRRHARERAELMLIEDDAFARRLVENVLGKRYAMTSLDTAEGALATYARLAPDVLFLDINLPDVTGHELLARIVALDPEAHVVMISSNADHENISRALKIGAKGFVAKPFTREKLIQYIQRCPTISQAEQML